MTKLQRRIRRPADERGFTLIELLVVIIILGILAAVVVFAVNGVGDKGKSSAVAIDERTVRTAEEAYCAKNGRYADGATLVAEGFLSDQPEYHGVVAQNTGSGPCNGWSVSVLPTSAADSSSGKWTLAPSSSPHGQGALVRLTDGRVLHLACGDPNCDALGGTATAVWDPNNGQWSVDDTTPSHPISFSKARTFSYSVVLTENCGSNCGKVLMDMQQGYHLFDPDAASGAQWENLGPTDYSNFAFNIGRLVQFRDVPATPANECGSNCGKVLIYASAGNLPGFELYDPTVSGPAAFTVFDPVLPSDSSFNETIPLPDGRVLLVGSIGDNPGAILLDPATLQVTAAATPILQHNFVPGTPLMLPNGEILFPSSFGGSLANWEIYTPQPGGPGTWRQAASPSGCFTPPTARACASMALLPDGRVLAASSNSSNPYLENRLDQTAWLFDPATDTWSQTADKPHARLLHSVLLDPNTGPCGAYCNKVLAHTGLPGEFPLVTAFFTP